MAFRETTGDPIALAGQDRIFVPRHASVMLSGIHP
jgi:hypothetical protein